MVEGQWREQDRDRSGENDYLDDEPAFLHRSIY